MIETEMFNYLEKSFNKINRKLDELLTHFDTTTSFCATSSSEIDWDAKLEPFIFKIPKTRVYPYAKMFQSLIKGKDNRIILLHEGYIFNENHIKIDVFKYIASGQLSGGYPIELKSDNIDHIDFGRIVLEGLNGIFYGAVCFNEAGLIFYYPFNTSLEMNQNCTLTM